MQENYGKVSRKDCAQHFQVATTIDRWVKQLGLRKQQGSKVIREKRKVPVEVEDSRSGKAVIAWIVALHIRWLLRKDKQAYRCLE